MSRNDCGVLRDLNPTVPGYALVVPRRHVEDVVRDFTPDEYLALQAVVHWVARAIIKVVPTERTYVLSLGSMQGQRARPLAHPAAAMSSLPAATVSRADG